MRIGVPISPGAPMKTARAAETIPRGVHQPASGRKPFRARALFGEIILTRRHNGVTVHYR